VIKHGHYNGFLISELVGDVIIAADSARVRREILSNKEILKDHRVFNGAYNDDTITISQAPPWGDNNPYEEIPSWVGTSQIVAALLLGQVLNLVPAGLDYTGLFYPNCDQCRGDMDGSSKED